MPKNGELAPDFALPNQDGEIIRLSDFRGRKVILFAFPKANSLGCTIQACSFRDALPQFENANAVVLGISGDTPEQLMKFKNGQRLTYDLLSDVEHEVLDAWDAWGVKMLSIISLPMARRSYWVIDEEGRVIDHQINAGPKESMERALQAVERAGTRA